MPSRLRPIFAALRRSPASPFIACVFAMHVAVAGLAGAPAMAADRTASQLLADELARLTRAYMRMEPVMSDRLAGSIEVARLCCELDPDNDASWRDLLELGVLADDPQLQATAVENILRLDPNDEVCRLRQLNRMVDQRQTVEERIAVYEQLLSPENRVRLTPAISSRLAHDLALLLRRANDVEGFARWLGEAAALDPSNRSAAAMAAGFFNARVDDSVASAELLLSAVMSDPADPNLQLELAQLSLREGAYAAAARMYAMALGSRESQGVGPNQNLAADVAIALWADGRLDEAMDVINAQQAMVDNVVRAEKLRSSTTLTRVDVAGETGLISPLLATVRAAILRQTGDRSADNAFQLVLRAYEKAIDEMLSAIPERDTVPPEALELYDQQRSHVEDLIAEMRLEVAFIALWLGGDYGTASQQLALVEESRPLSPEASQRFAGWQSLVRGEHEAAIAAFEPLAGADPLARFGQAEACWAMHRTKDAATAYLQIARSESGTAMGVWAALRLWEALGRRAPLSDVARRLDELIASLNGVYDRLPQRPSLAVVASLKPVKTTFAPFEPIMLELTITNRLNTPLAIDAEGPIETHVILNVRGQMVNSAHLSGTRQIVFDIARRLRLNPRESLTTKLDLRRYAIGGPLNDLPALGAALRIDAVLNPRIQANGATLPGLLGARIESPSIRIDGVRISAAWVEGTIGELATLPMELRAPRLTLLASAALLAEQLEVADVAAMREQLADVIVAAYAELDPPSQAWVVLTIPLVEDFLPIRDMAKKSDAELVQIAVMLGMIDAIDDPYFDAALSSESARVRTVARMAKSGLEHLDAVRRLQQKAAEEAAQGGAAAPAR